MDSIQALLDNGTAPALTALLLGLLTAISPCPLATNIAAIGFIGKGLIDDDNDGIPDEWQKEDKNDRTDVH